MPTREQIQTALKPLIVLFQFCTTGLCTATVSILSGGDSNTTTNSNSTINHDNSTSITESIKEILSDAKNSDSTLIGLSVCSIICLITTIALTHINDYLKNKDIQSKDISITELSTTIETLSAQPTARTIQIEPIEPIAMATYQHARTQSVLNSDFGSIHTSDIPSPKDEPSKASSNSTALPSPYDFKKGSNKPY